MAQARHASQSRSSAHAELPVFELEFELESSVVVSPSAVSVDIVAELGSPESAVVLVDAVGSVEVGCGPVDPGPEVTLVAPPATQSPASH